MCPISTGAPVEKPMPKFFFGFFAGLLLGFIAREGRKRLMVLAAGFAAVACNLALLLGLLLGHRWAYVLVIVFAIAGAVVAFGRGGNHGLFVLLGNGVVVLPVIFSSRYFFPHETVAGNSSKP